MGPWPTEWFCSCFSSLSKRDEGPRLCRKAQHYVLKNTTLRYVFHTAVRWCDGKRERSEKGVMHGRMGTQRLLCTQAQMSAHIIRKGLTPMEILNPLYNDWSFLCLANMGLCSHIFLTSTFSKAYIGRLIHRFYLGLSRTQREVDYAVVVEWQILKDDSFYSL